MNTENKQKTNYIGFDIDSELYKQFQALLVAKYGRTYGNAKKEFENALKHWIDTERKKLTKGGQ